MNQYPGCFLAPVRVLAAFAVAFVLVMASSGCTPPEEATPLPLGGGSYYHPGENTRDGNFTSCVDMDAMYQERLEELGGCPYYLFPGECLEHWDRAEDPAAPGSCGAEAVWWVEVWNRSHTCRDLYWSRGAYCHSLER